MTEIQFFTALGYPWVAYETSQTQEDDKGCQAHALIPLYTVSSRLSQGYMKRPCLKNPKHKRANTQWPPMWKRKCWSQIVEWFPVTRSRGRVDWWGEGAAGQRKEKFYLPKNNKCKRAGTCDARKINVLHTWKCFGEQMLTALATTVVLFNSFLLGFWPTEEQQDCQRAWVKYFPLVPFMFLPLLWDWCHSWWLQLQQGTQRAVPIQSHP